MAFAEEDITRGMGQFDVGRLDGPSLLNGRPTDIEGATGIQQRCRNPEHLQKDAEAEEQGQTDSTLIRRMDHLTTRTEQWACWTTLVETLPKRNRPTAPKPFAPVTIKSASCVSAAFRISSAGLPIVESCSTP